MNIELITHTPNPEELIIKAASICYRSEPKNHILNVLFRNKHFSPMEHASVTFLVEGISRVCSHQLVRHRIGCSYTQESQRYVNVESNSIIVPKSIKNDSRAVKMYKDNIDRIMEDYSDMVDNLDIPKEDVRFMLPQGITTNIMVTMTFTALLHFYAERSCEHSQWEINEVAESMKELIKDIAPTIYKNMKGRCHMLNINCKNKGCAYNLEK